MANAIAVIGAYASLQTQVSGLVTDVSALQTQALADEADIENLENKTRFMSSSNLTSSTNYTRFSDSLRMNNGVSDKLFFNDDGSILVSNKIEIENGNNINLTLDNNGNITSNGNLTVNGSTINIGNPNETSTVYIYGNVYMPTQNSFNIPSFINQF